jgi:carboxypeptidase family protein/TonB-dependent receptor-like protein
MSKQVFGMTGKSIGGSAIVLSLIGMLLVSTPVLAQTGRGVIRGVVRDANQAVVPGAGVTVTNDRTGVSQNTQSNAEGIYYFGAVPIGPYTLVAEVAGFKKWSTKFELQVGQTAAIDVALELGNVETVVDVVAAAPAITTESAEVSDVKDFQRIQQLPLNGRQISQLFVLTPGVEGEAGGTNAPRVNGLKVGSVEISLDGISVVDRFGGGLRPAQPGLDTIQEFRIETVGSDARYSRPATVTLATRSGTNQFHGSVFEYHRNNDAGLRTRNRLDTTGGANKLIRNEYGVTAGGPFMVPGYDGRNKSFWFFNYEGFKQRQERLTVSAVPTDAMWGGDFSNFIDDNGNLTRLYDPLTTDSNGLRQPFPNNRIPANRLSNTLKVLQQLTAKPTNSINPFVGSNYEKAYGVKEDRGTYTIKGDHNLTAKDRLSVRYSSGTRNNKTEGGLYGNPVNVDAGLGTGRSDFKYRNVSASYTRNFSPTFLNELLIGVNRNNNSSGTLADFKDWPKELGLPNPFGVTGWPTLYASGAYPWGYWDSDNRGDQQLTAIIAENNATWIKGKHTFQFGGKFRPEQNNVRELQQAQGSHNWGGEWTSLWDPAEGQAVSRTGNGFADLALGLPDYLSNQFNHGYFYFRQTERSLYFNDNWKVSPRLTVNFGVRWDNWTPYTEKFDRLVGVDIDTIATKFEVVTPGSVDIYSLRDVPRSVLDSYSKRGMTYTTADKIGYPSKLFASDNNNFAPRLGAAFKLTDKTVIRGGYGEYFWGMPLNMILQDVRSNAPLNLRYTYEPQFFDGSGDYLYRSAPTSQFFSPNATVKTDGIVELPGPRGSSPWDARNWKDGRSQNWHLTVEREIMKDTAIRLSYIGNHGRDLEQRQSLNTQEAEYNYVARTGQLPPSNRNLLRVNPDWSFSQVVNRTGFSNSNSAQIEIERKYSNGIAFQWFYVYTRALTTADPNGFDCCGGRGINSTSAGGTIPENKQILGSPSLSFEQLRKLAYYNSTTVPPHRIGYNMIVDLPFGKGKKLLGGANSVVNQIVGGWQVATIGNWRGGFWTSLPSSQWVFSDPILSPDQRVELTFNGRRQRLWIRGDFNPAGATNVTGGDLLALVPADRGQRAIHPQGPNFDNRLPQTLANGTVRTTPIGDLYNYTPRGFITGPGNWNADISLFKWFDITESIRLRFTADFFNAFNHPVDINPNLTTGLQDLSQQRNEPRIIQLSLRLNW